MSRATQDGESDEVDFSLDEIRLNRQWAAIAARLENDGPRLRWKAAFPMALLVALGAVALTWKLREVDEPVAGRVPTSAKVVPAGGNTVPQGPESALQGPKSALQGPERVPPRMLDIAGRARVELVGSATVQEVPAQEGALRVRLRGSARFEVKQNRERSFEVLARDVLVRVVGTRFEVRSAQSEVQVEVFEGTVEVERHGRTTRLERGQSWSSASEEEPTERSQPALGKEAASGSDTRAADRLFEEASTARLAGESALAARRFEEFARRHPGDARAGLASLEAARILQDVLKEPQRALGSLDEAARRPETAVAEPALARKVELLSDLGRLSACRELRRQYLERFPAGSHTALVQRACSSSQQQESAP